MKGKEFYKFLYDKEGREIPLRVKIYHFPEIMSKDEFMSLTFNDLYVILKKGLIAGKLIPQEKIDNLSLNTCYELLMTASDTNKFRELCNIFGQDRLERFRLPDICDLIKKFDIDVIFNIFGYDRLSKMTEEMKYDLVSDSWSGERNYIFLKENGLINKDSYSWGIWG